jgi:hypothetical protein
LILPAILNIYIKIKQKSDYYRGADDLLPILCYVIVKAGQPQILSECLILEEFIHEG